MKSDAEIISKIAQLSAEFESDAEKTDTSGPGNRLLRFNIARLGKLGFFGAGISPTYGGLGLSSDTIQKCHMTIASACGVTAFTQQQLHSGGGYVGEAQNEDIKKELLPQFASGALLCGIAFSHLRRPGQPAVTAVSRQGGDWIINGEAPWVTGWRFLDAFVLGAVDPSDGHLVYFYVPIADYFDAIKASPAIRLITMDAGDTVRVTLENLKLPNKFRLFERPADHMKRADYCGITGHVWHPLGCASGSVRQLKRLAAESGRTAIAEAAGRFDEQIDTYRKDALTWTEARSDEPGYKEKALQARANSIDVAVRAAASCIAASGGAAHLPTNPAQRRLREASFYITIAQTPDVQAGYLEVSSHG